MNRLYKIKPLEWFPSGQSSHEDYRVFKEKGKFKATYGEWDSKYEVYSYNELVSTDTEEEAKDACESHRRKLLEAELELVFDGEEQPSTLALRELLTRYRKAKDATIKPTTELPTEPGLYALLKELEKEEQL